MTQNLYIVIGRTKWMYPRVKRTCRKRPRLGAEEVAFKLVIDIPGNIFEGPTVEVKIDQQHVIRPIPKVTPQNTQP